MRSETSETSATSTGSFPLATRQMAARLAARARRLALDERVALGLAVLAFALRLWPLGTFSIEFDEGVYWQSLRALAAGHPLFTSVFSSQPPAFLLSILPFYSLFGSTLGAARFGVALYSMVGVVSFYAIGRALCGRWAGLLAGALLAFDPLYLTESHTLQAEAPALAWLALAVVLAVYAPRANDSRRARVLAFGAGVFLALGILTKLFDVIGLVPVVCYLGQPWWSAALGDDGRLRVPPPMLLRQRLAEVRSVAVAAILGGGVVTAFVLLPFVGRWGTLWSQVVTYHLTAGATVNQGLGYNLRLLATTLSGDLLLPVAALAILLLAITGHVRDWPLLPPALWALAAFAFLVRQQPLLVHDITLITPPLALFAALALGLAWRVVTEPAGAEAPRLAIPRRQSLSRASFHAVFGRLGVFRVAVLALAGLAVTCGVVFSVNADVTAARFFPAAEVEMALALDATTPSRDVVVTDDPYAAALANRSVPPQLVDPSSVRIQSGYLTASQLERIITQDDTRTILFGTGRFTQIPGFQQWVSAHFQQAIDFGHERILYIKVPVQDLPV